MRYPKLRKPANSISRLINDVLYRFDFFNDSVLESIRIDYASSPSGTVSVVFICQDDQDDQHRRKRCTILFSDVGEYKLFQPTKTSMAVVSFGVSFFQADDMFYMNFDCWGDLPNEGTLEDIQFSDFYISARSVEISVSDDFVTG
ncbi:hypothetical protein J5J10_04895 [Ciceribacter sp. L1K23]|uniref:hypothetical protein n=1 Tax=unclassified Ciceribacter TaxID=2628820 RepID=UPI001ABED601|nr:MULTISPECIES: hypothetical protein [unclassified Ciceribacter]MBO3760929.1 hypothetical protein [Ciceribacter sp. L1K22]MBR0555012.1 hypothetical protein [Ciceribacter sp. L1K23]